MKMYFQYVKMQLKSSLQYRASTFMMMFVQVFSSLATLVGVYMLFLKFDNIAGYTFNEVLITYGVILLVFSLCEFIFRGFDQFEKLIVTGELDKLLIKPRSIFLQVLGYKLEFGKLGRVTLSLLVLIYAAVSSSIEWNALKLITLISMVVSGLIIYLGVFLLSSSFCIFTVQGTEVVNIITNGGRETASYPLDIYNKAFTKIFTFLIPFACFNYLPLQYLLDYPGVTIFGNMLAPYYGMLFIIPCYFIFKWSLTKYKSTGS